MKKEKKIIRWKLVKPSVGPFYQKGIVGDTRFFTISNSLTDEKFVLSHFLPGLIINGPLKYDTVEMAIIDAETLFESWLEKSNLKVK
jgi:hypothetical protein